MATLPTVVETVVPETKEEARKQQAALHSIWWEAYRKRGAGPQEAAQEEALKLALDQFTNQAIEKFGVKSDCAQCRRNSVFGGPGHNPSPHCRSGKRPHCTCDLCF